MGRKEGNPVFVRIKNEPSAADVVAYILLMGALVYFDARYDLISSATWEKLLNKGKRGADHGTQEKADGVGRQLTAVGQESHRADDNENQGQDKDDRRSSDPSSLNADIFTDDFCRLGDRFADLRRGDQYFKRRHLGWLFRWRNRFVHIKSSFNGY